MIWGEAGVGKTTFCSKFLLDWAIVVKEKEGKGQELTEEQKSELEKLTEEQRSKLNNIGLLLFIVLRDIGQGAKIVKDIITSQLGFQKEGTFMSQCGLENQILCILKNVSKHSKIVLLMDGFDEISDKDETIENVITGRTYQNIHCITTCRPHATGGIVLEVDVEIRLKGFSEAQAKSFVEMYSRIKYTEQDQIESFVKETMSQIESSVDLLEMSTNPSILQLLCLLSWEKVRIGKNRTSVFKYYTCYLLNQYHIKKGNKEMSYTEKTLYELYHQNLLDAGKVALMGLQQNQLQLVFSKSVAHQIGGEEIFKIGFLTELPGTGNDDTDTDVKVQFTHKTLQEYLAAYYVVNSPGDEGLQLVMEFCCTSQRLMGSQIILEFISNMSTKIGKKIQKQIQDYVSKWDLEDNVDPKSRTSFLISMLKGNKTLTFPLPAVVEIDLREFDFMSHRFRKFFKFLYRQKSTLEKFFEMDGTGVKKLILILGEYNRMNVLQNTTTDFDSEVLIDYCNTWFKKDNEDLRGVMKKIKPGLLSITNCKRKLMDKDTITVILQHVHTLILEKCDLDNEHLLIILKTKHQLKVLTVNESGANLDCAVIEAVSKLSSDIKLHISGKEITLIHNQASMKSVSLCNCDLKIDTEIAEAVSRLPEHTQLNLSGNRVRGKSACITLIHKAATMKSLNMCNCGIKIDTEIAKAVSRLPDHTELDLSGNEVTDKSACITLLHKAANMKSLHIHNCMSNCGIQIDTEIAEAVSRLDDHAELDLSGNDITMMKPYLLSRTLLYMTKQEKIDIDKWGITVDEDIVRALSKLSKLRRININSAYFGNNKLTSRAASELPHTVSSMPHLQVLYLDNCDISNDVMVTLTDSLYKHCPLLEEMTLSYNRLSSGVWEVVKHIKQMKNLRRLWLDGNPCMWYGKPRDKIRTTLHRSNPDLIVWL